MKMHNQLKKYMGVLLTASALALSGSAMAQMGGPADEEETDEEEQEEPGMPMQDRHDASNFIDAQFEPPEEDEEEEDEDDEGMPGM